MKSNAYANIMDGRAGKILAGSLVYGILFEILLYRNMNGIGIPVLMLVTCLFLAGFFRMFEMKIKWETLFYMAAMVLLGVSTILTTSGFFLMWNWFGSICMFFLILVHQFYDDRKWSFTRYLKIYLRMWFAPFGNLLSPFRALVSCKSRKAESDWKTASGYAGQILVGCIAAVLLLIVILPLLFSGDIVFASIIRSFTGNMDIFTFSTEKLFLFLFGFVLCFAVLQAFVNYEPDACKEETEERPIQVAGITCISILTAVYVAFCLIQVGVLFFGHQMKLPDGYTYAEYARSGFFQLMGVSLINLVIVLTVIHLFRPGKTMQRVLTVFSACTYILIFSSAYRMCMYIGAYQFTLLRVLVLWGLCVLSFIFAGVIVNVYKKDFPLFRYSAIVCVLCYLVLSFSRPDEWMVHYNLEHKEKRVETYDEIRYLFSTDSLSALDQAELTGNTRNLASYCREVVNTYDNEPGWTYNLGEARAKQAAKRFLSEYAKDTP